MSLRTAVGYCRVSTDKQVDQGVSMDAQASKIAAMASEFPGSLARTVSMSSRCSIRDIRGIRWGGAFQKSSGSGPRVRPSARTSRNGDVEFSFDRI